MDRWGYYTRWAEEERRRSRLIPAWVDACIFGLLVVCFVGGRVLHCATLADPFGGCLYDGVPRVLSMSLHSAALLFGIWAGPRIGLRINNSELGWVCGALIVVGISAALVWIGLPIGAS